MPNYFAYGLTWSSEIALPGLPERAGAAGASPDIVIVEGSVAANDVAGVRPGEGFAQPGRALIELAAGGRILIEDGQRITCQRAGLDGERDLSAAILSCGLAAILLQRGLLPLRGCAVMTPRGAIVVVGDPGAGTSWLLGGMLELGHAMIADGLAAISLDPQGQMLVHPAAPELAGRSVERFHSEPAPIAGIVWLVAGAGEESRLTALDPEERAEPLGTMIPHRERLCAMGLEHVAAHHVAALAERVPMVCYERPAGGYGADAIARHALAAVGV